MVLSDRSITRLIDEGRIVIDPYDPALMQPASLDVRVDRLFRVFRNNRYPYIDVKREQEGLTELVEVDDGDPFILHPGEFVLGSTLERVKLPDDLVARLEGKSSLGRLGLLIHSTAGFIDPGLGRARHARAVERGQPADHDLSGDEDRAAVVRPDGRADRSPVRLERARLEVPGPARPDPEPVLAQLRRARSTAAPLCHHACLRRLIQRAEVPTSADADRRGSRPTGTTFNASAQAPCAKVSQIEFCPAGLRITRAVARAPSLVTL